MLSSSSQTDSCDDRTSGRSTWALIGERYLDTQFDEEYIAELEAELRSRGIVGVRRWIMEYLSAASHWQNIIWWDWYELDGGDVCFGWIVNVILFSIPTAIAWLAGGPTAGLITIAVLHILTTALGFGLRSGTRKSGE